MKSANELIIAELQALLDTRTIYDDYRERVERRIEQLRAEAPMNPHKLRDLIEETLHTPELLESRDRFHTIVSSAMTALELNDADLAGRLPVSVSGISRWRYGLDAPLPMMRKPIYKLLLRRVEARLFPNEDVEERIARERQIAEDNDRSYCIARDALESTRAELAQARAEIRELRNAANNPRVRDDSIPPPGWEHEEGLAPQDAWAEDSTGFLKSNIEADTLEEAWKIYDAEHGYAPPHMSPADHSRWLDQGAYRLCTQCGYHDPECECGEDAVHWRQVHVQYRVTKATTPDSIAQADIDWRSKAFRLQVQVDSLRTDIAEIEAAQRRGPPPSTVFVCVNKHGEVMSVHEGQSDAEYRIGRPGGVTSVWPWRVVRSDAPSADEDTAGSQRLVKTLAEALAKYGGHLHDCKGRDGNTGPKGRSCTCGWGFEDDDEGAHKIVQLEAPMTMERLVRGDPDGGA